MSSPVAIVTSGWKQYANVYVPQFIVPMELNSDQTVTAFQFQLKHLANHQTLDVDEVSFGTMKNVNVDSDATSFGIVH